MAAKGTLAGRGVLDRFDGTSSAGSRSAGSGTEVVIGQDSNKGRERVFVVDTSFGYPRGLPGRRTRWTIVRSVNYSSIPLGGAAAGW